MLCVVGFALIAKQGAYSFYITIVLLFARLNQHQVYPRHALFFFAYPMHNHTIIFPAKDIYCEAVILSFKPVNLFYWCGENDATVVNTEVDRVAAWSVCLLTFWCGK